MGKVGCDIWAKWVRWAKLKNTRIKGERWEKWGATYGRNGVRWAKNKYLEQEFVYAKDLGDLEERDVSVAVHVESPPDEGEALLAPALCEHHELHLLLAHLAVVVDVERRHPVENLFLADAAVAVGVEVGERVDEHVHVLRRQRLAQLLDRQQSARGGAARGEAARGEAALGHTQRADGVGRERRVVRR